MFPAVAVFVRGSEVVRWRRAAAHAFDVRKAVTWQEASAKSPIDAGYVLFHLAERLGLAGAEGRCVIADDARESSRIRRWVVSPRLPTELVRRPAGAIERVVVESFAAVLAYNEASTETVSTLSFLGTDLGETSGLTIEARAAAVSAGIASAKQLLD